MFCSYDLYGAQALGYSLTEFADDWYPGGVNG